MTSDDDKAFLDAIRRPDGSLPPLGPPGGGRCRICGKPDDHFHSRWNGNRNVVVEDPPMPWDEPCPMGGSHRLTSPKLWVGTSCAGCHKTWEGDDMVPTWRGTA